MTTPLDPSRRHPKGDLNRRIALGLGLDLFAAEAGVSPEDLRQYEITGPDDDVDVAWRVGEALSRLEAHPPASQIVASGEDP